MIITPHNLIDSVFRVFIGREPDNASLEYWLKANLENPGDLRVFLGFIRFSEEFVHYIGPQNREYLLKLIYDQLSSGSGSGNPFLINESGCKVYFLHIPKAAGISISAHLAQRFHPLQIKGLCFGDHGIKEMHKLLIGHFSVNEIPFDDQKTIKIISLREPRSRIVSLYRFLSKVPDEDLIWGAAAEAAKALSFIDFLRIEDPRVIFSFDNYYVRVLSGKGLPGSDLEGKIDDSVINTAKRNLQKFYLILKTESIGQNSDELNKMVRELDQRPGVSVAFNFSKLNAASDDWGLDEPDRASIPEKFIAVDLAVLEKFYL